MIWRQSGSPHAVIDVKYKAPRPTGMANADAYQMFAYCTALGLSQGFLVYAKNSGEQIRILTIKNTGCEIRVRTLDVERSAEQLIQQVAMSPMRSRLGAQRQSPPLPEAQRGAPTWRPERAADVRRSGSPLAPEHCGSSQLRDCGCEGHIKLGWQAPVELPYERDGTVPLVTRV